MSLLHDIVSAFHDMGDDFLALFGLSNNRMKIRRLEEERRLAELRSQLDGGPATVNRPIIWLGTQRELAAHIVDLYNKGKISATSERQAVMQSAPHFVIKPTNGDDPKDINPDSIWRNYHQQIR